MTISIVDTFLAMLYRNSMDGSHIVTVVGVEHDPSRTVYQRYRGEMSWESSFMSLFDAVQRTLDNGELCVILIRSLIGNGPANPATIVLRAWTLTHVGIIPVDADDLALQTAREPELALEYANIVYADGWDQDLDMAL